MSDTIIGVVIGGVIGIVGALAIELVRGRREDRFRHVAEKREAYANFLRYAEVIQEHAQDRLSSIELGQKPAQRTTEFEDLSLAYERIELIGDESVLGASRLLYLASAVHNLFGWGGASAEEYLPYDDLKSDRWRKARADAMHARSTFLKVARVDLGIAVRPRPDLRRIATRIATPAHKYGPPAQPEASPAHETDEGER